MPQDGQKILRRPISGPGGREWHGPEGRLGPFGAILEPSKGRGGQSWTDFGAWKCTKQVAEAVRNTNPKFANFFMVFVCFCDAEKELRMPFAAIMGQTWGTLRLIRQS